jgi:type II secretory pathway predicted ATPase ExeA/tetratricopeptide (TPR) repeat protein
MYTEHFGLERNPFLPGSAAPPPFSSKELKEALAHFLYALRNRDGFFLLAGEVGTGKSTAIRAMLSALPPDTPRALVRHTSLDDRELLEEVLRRFGLEALGSESKPALLARLERFLASSPAGDPAVLIVDEAQVLPPLALEELRLLSNLKQEDRPLLQICLVGQPELVARLREHPMRPLRQRIAVRYVAGALSREETGEYIAHRLRTAGAHLPRGIFSPAAVEAVHEMTHGLPREINVVAGQAMLNAYLDGASTVAEGHVRSTKRDYGFEGLRHREPAREEAKPAAVVETPAAPEPEPDAYPTDLDLHSFPTLPPWDEGTRFGPAIPGIAIGVVAFLAAGLWLVSRPDSSWESIPKPPVSRQTAPPLLSPPAPSEDLWAQAAIAETPAEEPRPEEAPATDPANIAEEPRRLPPSTPPSRTLPSADPTAADRLEMGTSLARSGRFDEAIAAFREALRIEPGYANAYYNLGLSLLETQRPREAADALESAISLSPGDAGAQRALGVALRQSGEQEEAVRALRRAVALDSGDVLALQHLGRLHRERGELEEAAAAIRNAIRLKPEEPSLYQELGFTLRAEGRLEEAVTALESAVELDSNLALAHYTLGVTLYELGRRSDAEIELAEAKRLGYDPKE